MRMWIYSREHAGELEGENASLRFAIGMARNIARNEARRNGRLAFLPPEELPDTPIAPEPFRDARLAQFIRDCFKSLAEKPRVALGLRLDGGAIRHDRQLAEALGMTLNTFLQNIVRARAQMLDCLARKKVPLEELGI